MLAVVSQVIPVESGEIVQDLIGTWQPYVAFVAPIFLGLITSEDTRAKIKQALPILVAAVLGVISILTEDGMTWRTLVFRIPALFVAIETGYRTLSGVASAVRREDISVNDVLGKSFGLVK